MRSAEGVLWVTVWRYQLAVIKTSIITDDQQPADTQKLYTLLLVFQLFLLRQMTA